eukprot:8063593-Alexandrium_andersonii.AAC.1
MFGHRGLVTPAPQPQRPGMRPCMWVSVLCTCMRMVLGAWPSLQLSSRRLTCAHVCVDGSPERASKQS